MSRSSKNLRPQFNSYLSRDEHQALYDYFYNIADKGLVNLEENWRKIGRFDPRYSFRLSKILYFVASDMPDHRVGSALQRKSVKFIKENFSIWEDKALLAMKDFDGQALSNAVWAMAILGVSPTQKFMNNVAKNTKRLVQNKQNPDHFNNQNFSNILWGIAVLQSQNPGLDLKPVYDDIRSLLDEDDLEHIPNIKQVYDADLYFYGQSNLQNPLRTETANRDEFRLMKVFKRAGYNAYKPETCPIKGLNQAIDLVVEDKSGNKINIELDGDNHFNNPAARRAENLKYNSATKFRSALMTRLNPDARIIRIDHKLHAVLRQKPEVQNSFAHTLFQRALQKPAGCYRVAPTQDWLKDMVLKPENSMAGVMPSSGVDSPPNKV